MKDDDLIHHGYMELSRAILRQAAHDCKSRDNRKREEARSWLRECGSDWASSCGYELSSQAIEKYISSLA